MLKLLSLFVCILILLGVYFRKNKERHVTLMMTAFSLDMLMVLYIEITREAINTSLHPPHGFVIFHVIISVLVVILYGVQIVTGIKMYKTGIIKPIHRYVAVAFIVLRLGNFATSLFVEDFSQRTLQKQEPVTSSSQEITEGATL